MSKQRAAAANAGKPRLADEAETAEYIADMLTQLGALAASHGFTRLCYQLIAAKEEAARLAAA